MSKRKKEQPVLSTSYSNSDKKEINSDHQLDHKISPPQAVKTYQLNTDLMKILQSALSVALAY